MNDETDRRDILKLAGVGFATASTSGCLDSLPFSQEEERNSPVEQNGSEKENDPERDVSRESDTVGNDTSGVIETTESSEDEGAHSDVNIDELRQDMEVPEPLADSGSNAFGCTDAKVAHTFVKKRDEADFYNYRIDNTDGRSGRVVVGVFFYGKDGRIRNSAQKRVFVGSDGSESGKLSLSQSNRQYPVYLITVTEQDCS